MKEELQAVALKLWREHTGKCLGTFIGALAGIAIMIFGFFSVLFVAPNLIFIFLPHLSCVLFAFYFLYLYSGDIIESPFITD